MDTSRLKRPLNEMPEDVALLLERENLLAAFQQRPPYQQNDYLSWIKRAKMPATREKRVAQMLDELRGGNLYMKMAYRPK
jgi:uncharacterized protein YdeI (YjbR/CyaY-like superfamily)